MGFFAGVKRLNVILVLMAVTLAPSVMGEDNVPTEIHSELYVTLYCKEVDS